LAKKRKTGRAPRKLVVLETYWGDHKARLFRTPSVLPFFEGLSAQLDPPLRIAHRYVDSLPQLFSYSRYRKGLLWRDRETFDTPVYYLSFHGAPGKLITALSRIGAGELYRAFRGWGSYDNLVYFGACSVFKGKAGERFAKAFLKASGCRAVLGYTTDVAWMGSMVSDLLMLHRFYTDPKPWTNLRKIHQSVLEDYAPAKRLGLTLVQA
jgi:hypothetical protein